MGAIKYMQQVKVTCKKETFGNIENIDKKQRNKLSKLVDRYIFTVETIFGEEVSGGEGAIEQWEIDHPNIIGKNVAKNIKNCVKYNYNCYLRTIDQNDNPGLNSVLFCIIKTVNNGEYGIGEQYIKLVVDSNNKVAFRY